jgi:glutamyl-tRNA synthetase
VDPGARDLTPLVNAVKVRARTMLHVAELVAVRLDPARAPRDAKADALVRKLGPAFAGNLRLATDALERLDGGGWTAEPILDCLKQVADAHGLKLGDVMQPVRIALTGSTVSEPVNELLTIIGRPVALARLREVARSAEG